MGAAPPTEGGGGPGDSLRGEVVGGGRVEAVPVLTPHAGEGVERLPPQPALELADARASLEARESELDAHRTHLAQATQLEATATSKLKAKVVECEDLERKEADLRYGSEYASHLKT